MPRCKMQSTGPQGLDPRRCDLLKRRPGGGKRSRESNESQSRIAEPKPKSCRGTHSTIAIPNASQPALNRHTTYSACSVAPVLWSAVPPCGPIALDKILRHSSAQGMKMKAFTYFGTRVPRALGKTVIGVTFRVNQQPKREIRGCTCRLYVLCCPARRPDRFCVGQPPVSLVGLRAASTASTALGPTRAPPSFTSRHRTQLSAPMPQPSKRP